MVEKEDINPRTELDYLPSPYLTGWLDPFLKAGYSPRVVFANERILRRFNEFAVFGLSVTDRLRMVH